MDIHHDVDDLAAEAVEEALRRDLEVQGDHGVEYLRYWYNEREDTVFCLCRAPNMEAADTVRREAHGLVADEIVEVREGTWRGARPRPWQPAPLRRRAPRR